MDHVRIGGSELKSSRLIYGCMRLADLGSKDVAATLDAAVNAGYSQFDLADIYADGACETLLGKFLSAQTGLRDKITITSKCGIRMAGAAHPESPKHYDLSADHIVASVRSSLRRLGTDRLDLLLLHRPDYLMDPEEVAKAFQLLKQNGEVLNFGVSNFNVSQVQLLQACLDEPLRVNQIEINIQTIDALDNGVLSQCQKLAITPQAWSPLAGVVHDGWSNVLTSTQRERVDVELSRQAKMYNVTHWQIILAWLMHHPSGIMPIIGSTNPDRIQAATAALDVPYGRDSWYRLLEARRGSPVP